MARDTRAVAARHGFSLEAVQHAAEALAVGNGQAAQFAHPEFGGRGQWMPGMTMIGDPFNAALKARVGALFADLTALPAEDRPSPAHAWPGALGAPSMESAQNEIRCAYFPAAFRLAVRTPQGLTLYDTSGLALSGISVSNGVVTVAAGGQALPLSALRRLWTEDAGFPTS